ncbi:hypothetical protein R3X26_14115 [Vibrio sp. TH_r3]|uniref:hypothetical protein n=1 Tax=Vibrio sp. TH_r3 TaxID=3082084 RepID=UPI0029529688|nr:hypothetical protein [Vibrio sp. TH_r3]MDV7105538.1 hypothetical protein [Vibrio sp. TH_r3]
MSQSKVNILSRLVMYGCIVFSTSSFADLYVEQWLQPIIPIKTANDQWQMKPLATLPHPPVSVLQQEGAFVQVKLRRIGTVWVPKTVLRLNEESLSLVCQETASARASDYQNYGMRGDDSTPFICIVK